MLFRSTQQYKHELQKVNHLHLWADTTITILDISGLSAMELLQLYSVSLSTLNVDGCDTLNTIQASYCNSLKDLSLDHLSSIETCVLYANNSLSGFDVGAVTTLIDLEITNCPISGRLDFVNNPDLDYVIVTGTSVNEIAISPVNSPVTYNFESNQLTQEGVDDILLSSADNAAVGNGSYLSVDGLNNSYPSDVGYTAIATLTANNWTVIYNNPPAWDPTHKGSNIQLSNFNRTATQLNGLMQSVIGNREIHGTDKVMFTIELETLSTEVSGQFIGIGTSTTNVNSYLGSTNESIGKIGRAHV